MLIYILNLITIIIYSFFIKDRKKYIFIVSFQLFLLLALRKVTLGVDLPYYNAGYYYIKNLNFMDLLSKIHILKNASLVYPFNFESGYTIFCWIISKLNFNFHSFLIFCAAINMYALGKFIYKYSENPCISFIVLFCFETYCFLFGILRQSLAISMFLLSFIACMDNKKIKSLLLCFLAFWFHRSTIIAVPLLFVANKNNITKKQEMLYFISIIPFFVFSRNIYLIFYKVMIFFGKGGYIGTDFNVNNLSILFIIIYLLTIIFANGEKMKSKKIYSKLIYALLFAIFISIMGSYNEVLGRSTQFFTTFLIILIPNVISIYENQKSVIIVKIVVILLLTAFMLNYYQSRIVPYQIEPNIAIFDK